MRLIEEKLCMKLHEKPVEFDNEGKNKKKANI